MKKYVLKAGNCNILGDATVTCTCAHCDSRVSSVDFYLDGHTFGKTVSGFVTLLVPKYCPVCHEQIADMSITSAEYDKWVHDVGCPEDFVHPIGCAV